MTVRILHTADLHLGAPLKHLGRFAPQRHGDFLKTFDRIVNAAIKHEADFLLVAGDLFDNPWPEPDLVGRVQAAFTRLKGRGVRVIVIPGTHDHAMTPDSVWLRQEFDAAVLAEPALSEPAHFSVRGEDVFFYGFAYRAGDPAEALASMKRRAADGIHIGLLHGSLQGNPEWETRRKDIPFTRSDLAALQLDYVALGHYHSLSVVETPDRSRVLGCYPGTPEGRKFGEEGARYAVIADIGGELNLDRVEVQSRQLVQAEVDVSLCPDRVRLEEEILRVAPVDSIARVTLKGTVEAPVDVTNLAARLQERYGWLELEDETDLLESDLAHRLAREESIRGLFVRKMEERAAKAATDEERLLCREALKLALGRFREGGMA